MFYASLIVCSAGLIPQIFLMFVCTCTLAFILRIFFRRINVLSCSFNCWCRRVNLHRIFIVYVCNYWWLNPPQGQIYAGLIVESAGLISAGYYVSYTSRIPVVVFYFRTLPSFLFVFSSHFHHAMYFSNFSMDFSFRQ